MFYSQKIAPLHIFIQNSNDSYSGGRSDDGDVSNSDCGGNSKRSSHLMILWKVKSFLNNGFEVHVNSNTA